MSRPASAHKSQTEQGAAPLEGTAPSLAGLVNPTTPAAFFRDYWEKQTLVVKRGRPDYFSALLSLDELDRVLTTLDRRYPNVTLKNADHPLTADDYTVEGDALDVARVYQLFDEGATIAFSFLDTVLPPLTQFCRALEAEFSAPFQTNVYLTPPGAKGARVHYDTHDVFVLQVTGSKHWTIYGTPLELPLSTQEFDPEVHQPGAPTMEFDLEPGDTAYIPRGVVHDARSGPDVSVHITAGVLVSTWADLLLEVVAGAALQHAALRRALPPGFARGDFDREPAWEAFEKLWRQIPSPSGFDGVLDRFADAFLAMCPPPLRGQMAQMAGLATVGPGTIVGARTGLIVRVRSEQTSIIIDCYGRTIKFPLHAAEAVRFALGKSRFAVRDLPGPLDDAGKVTLARRLIREGLLLAYTAAS